MSEEARVPAFKRGVKFRFDTVRDAWAVLAPERMFVPDEHAAAVLKLVDGVRSLGGIADELASIYDAPREVILPDVAALLQDLAGKGVLSW